MVDIPQVSVTDLDDEITLLDVREPNEYASGRAAGAISIPMGQVRERLDEVRKLGEPIHVICAAGSRSQKVAEFLDSEGINAVNVMGGTNAWRVAGKKMTADEGEPTLVKPSTPPPAAV